MATLAFLLEAKSLELRKHNLNLYFTGFHEYWFQYYDFLFLSREKKKVLLSVQTER